MARQGHTTSVAWYELGDNDKPQCKMSLAVVEFQNKAEVENWRLTAPSTAS